MKTLLAIIVALMFIQCAYVSYTLNKLLGNTSTQTQVSFDATDKQIESDLVNNSVSFQPLGQVWSFAEDQNIYVKILQSKPTDDGAVVYVNIDATAEVKKDDKTNATVQLQGIAKLHYEFITEEKVGLTTIARWHLVGINSISLHATQK